MRKRIYIYILVIWLLSAITNGSKPLKAQLDETSHHCTWSNISYPKQIFIPCYTTLTFFIPIIIIWISFLHVARILKTSLAERDSERFRRTRKKLTQMCALVAGLLTICWLPNQIFYTLSAFDITTAQTSLHHFTIVLAMFNSCVNPLVCCFTYGDYRTAVKRTLCCCRPGKVFPYKAKVMGCSLEKFENTPERQQISCFMGVSQIHFHPKRYQFNNNKLYNWHCKF